MKFVEIEKFFTGNVCRFLAEGWIFHTKSMTGHQGEISKVDLQNDGDVIRVLLRNDMDHLGRRYMEIETRRHAGKAGNPHIWNNDGKVLELRKFYRVDEDWFVGSVDEFEEVRRNRNERHDRVKIFDRELSERCRHAAWRWVKRNRKKSARLSDIVGVYRKSKDYNGFLIATKKGNYFIDMERL